MVDPKYDEDDEAEDEEADRDEQAVSDSEVAT